MSVVGRCWRQRFSPSAVFEGVPVEQVADWLRQVFQQWGLPQRFRVDNGHPWGGSGDLPPVLALWLMGLGIKVVWNHPHHPQENGCVERSHGVSKAWGEPQQCLSLEEFRQHLHQVIRLQQSSYPSIDGKPRTVAYPELNKVVRPYQLEQEAACWSLLPITQFFAQGLWWRRVEKYGTISFYQYRYRVGRSYARQIVSIHFDLQAHQWVICNQQGQEIIRHSAHPILSVERIRALQELRNKPPDKQNFQRTEKPEPLQVQGGQASDGLGAQPYVG